MSSPTFQLVFAGEVLSGFTLDQVQRQLARRLKLDDARVKALFTGRRVVIKRGLSSDDAQDWVTRFRAMGAQLHVAPMQRPPASAAPKPAVAKKPIALSLVQDSIPPPAPMARPAAPSPAKDEAETITCPNCGERQSKRVICRSCVCDMPRALASQQAIAEAARQARLEEQRARNEARLARDEPESTLDLPPLWSVSGDGRMGRTRYIMATAVAGILLLITLLSSLWLQSSPLRWLTVVLVLGLSAWSWRCLILRLHDINRSGWWSLLLLFPGLNGACVLFLSCWPGDADENDFGPTPDDANAFLAAFSVVALIATAVVTSSALVAGLRGLG